MLSVTAIIPHAGGREILHECLNRLAKSSGVKLHTIIVNNSPVDDIDCETLDLLPGVQVLRYECNLGFAAACNRGVEASKSDFVFLLNNDAGVEPDSIRILVERLAEDDSICACQPKILSWLNDGYFDYSSAAGGELDKYGFPFAKGRVFDTIEKDTGQYDVESEIFWGAGAALMLRRELYLSAGGLEEWFFAHMEEIDLLWRMQLMGYRVISVPSAVVLHKGAVTIQSGSFTKLYYNHRNSLATFFRNSGLLALIQHLPVRVTLDLAVMLFSIMRKDFVRFWAVMRAECWFWLSLPYLIRSRRQVQELRRVPDSKLSSRLFPYSIAWQYFIRKRRTWKELQTIKT